MDQDMVFKVYTYYLIDPQNSNNKLSAILISILHRGNWVIEVSIAYVSELAQNQSPNSESLYSKSNC
jgi:hypothetical protein